MMKKWFQILTGDNTESTPADISAEIEFLKTERAEVKAMADIAAENLSNARLTVLGGDVGRSAEIKNLEKEIVGHDSKLATLAAAVDGLQVKLTEAEGRELQAQIDTIDKQIQDLREFAKKIRPDYVRAKMTVEAYEQLLAAPYYGIGQPDKSNLWLTGNEREMYGKGLKEKICKGHGAISSEIMVLLEKKKKLEAHGNK